MDKLVIYDPRIEETIIDYGAAMELPVFDNTDAFLNEFQDVEDMQLLIGSVINYMERNSLGDYIDCIEPVFDEFLQEVITYLDLSTYWLRDDGCCIDVWNSAQDSFGFSGVESIREDIDYYVRIIGN